MGLLSPWIETNCYWLVEHLLRNAAGKRARTVVGRHAALLATESTVAGRLVLVMHESPPLRMVDKLAGTFDGAVRVGER